MQPPVTVPTSFHGICVDLSGTRAPVFGASDTQVNFQVPALTAGSVTVRVLTGCGTSTETASQGVIVQVAAASPEFFYFSYSTSGHNPVAATDSVSGAYLGTGTGFVPAQPGEYVTVYATGFGSTNPGTAAGDFPPALASATARAASRRHRRATLGSSTGAPGSKNHLTAVPYSLCWSID